MISHEAILAIMEKRFDHVSARVVLGEALKAAGLAANQKNYSPDEVRSLAKALAAVGTRVDAVTAALDGLAAAEAPTSAKTPKAEPEPAEPAAEAPAEVAPEEAPAEVAPEEAPAEVAPEEAPAETDAPSKKKKKK